MSEGRDDHGQSLEADDVLRAIRSVVVAEVAWYDQGLQAIGVIPLVTPHGPVLAFPWAYEDLARSIAASPQVLLTVTEQRESGTGFAPQAVHCVPRLVEDRVGTVFGTDLLDQELLRWPFSRTLADSVLLRRENWWWLPRLIVELDVVRTDALPPRDVDDDHVLVVAGARGWSAHIAAVSPSDLDRPPAAPSLELRGSAPGPGEAVLIGQDVSLPDLDRWADWSWSGRWTGDRLLAARAPEAIGLPRPPGLLERWRRQRRLERQCREALRRHADVSS